MAVRSFNSVGISVPRLCLMKLRTTLPDNQLVDWQVSCFAVNLQLKSLCQDRLKHTHALVRVKVVQFRYVGAIDLRLDIISFRVEPVGKTDYLVLFDPVSLLDQHLQRSVRDIEPIGGQAEHNHRSSRFV